ncbi:MAG: Bax inhibitor-1 family protein [Candidatus Melainabacteria bacterium]|nr:Bax inhibitor-1 family protein [Candidatus Melainabacteria bacterium]
MIACPKCKSYMFPGRKKGVQIDCCSNCNGVWLDRGELATITQTGKDIPDAEPMSKTQTNFSCPRCGSNLNEQPYAANNSLLIDSCTGCCGVYLDKGELEKIQLLAQQIEQVFDPKWQNDSKSRAIRSEALSSIYKTESPVSKASQSDRSSFIQRVYMLLIVTLLVTAAGAYYGVTTGLAVKYFFPALIAELIVFFIALGVRRMPVINMVVLFTYTSLSGFTLACVIERYLSRGQADIVWQAGVLCAVIFGVLSTYVHVTKKDFDWMGGFLFVALIGLILTGIAFFFWPNSFAMFAWSCISAFVFSGFILYDTSRILLKFDTNEVVSAVLELYLDVVNLFLDLLRILSYLRK